MNLSWQTPIADFEWLFQNFYAGPARDGLIGLASFALITGIVVAYIRKFGKAAKK